MADINDRLDRLQRREEFDRFGRPLRTTAATEDPADPVAKPAGVDDRLGEVLDAVATVVRRHPGLSVMVAIADGRAGRPVVRVTERDGTVETGVVVAGQSGPAAVSPAPAEQAAAVPTASAPLREPDPAYGRDEPGFGTGLDSPFGPVREAARREAELGRDGGETRRLPAYGRDRSMGGDPVFEPGGYELGIDQPTTTIARPHDGRHAAHDDEPRSGRSAPSWHDSLWSRDRLLPPADDPDRLRLVEEQEAIALPEETSQVVSRLAALLRDNPTLANSWSRDEAE